MNQTEEDNSQKTIFVVDDDESVLSFLTFSLKSEGFKTSGFSDAETALEKIQTTIPDLILLDIMLPKMDGFALCKTLRANPRFSKVPILFITAYVDPQSMKKTQEAGAQGLIEKPILFDGLLLQVYEALKGQFSLPTRLKFSS